MAFDGFKKMADSVPDYLEVPVTEDGLLEKATAAILQWRLVIETWNNKHNCFLAATAVGGSCCIFMPFGAEIRKIDE